MTRFFNVQRAHIHIRNADQCDNCNASIGGEFYGLAEVQSKPDIGPANRQTAHLLPQALCKLCGRAIDEALKNRREDELQKGKIAAS